MIPLPPGRPAGRAQLPGPPGPDHYMRVDAADYSVDQQTKDGFKDADQRRSQGLGDERSDLYTSQGFARAADVQRVALQRPQLPAAMTVRALGKLGDQIVWLFSQPTELLILPHCHQITPSVISMMEAYAHDLRNPRKYMIIDGAYTSRILKSRGLLTTSSLAMLWQRTPAT